MHFTNEEFVRAIFVTSLRLEALAQKAIFKPLGISSAAASVLGLLSLRGVLSPTEIKNILGSTKSNITQRLNLLTKKGLIEKIVADKDGRSIAVKLTEAGKKMEQELREQMRQKELRLSELFTQSEISAHIAFFRKINELIDQHQAGNCSCELDIK